MATLIKIIHMKKKWKLCIRDALALGTIILMIVLCTEQLELRAQLESLSYINEPEVGEGCVSGRNRCSLVWMGHFGSPGFYLCVSFLMTHQSSTKMATIDKPMGVSKPFFLLNVIT